MPRVSSPQKYLSYLEIASQLVAGVLSEDEADISLSLMDDGDREVAVGKLMTARVLFDEASKSCVMDATRADYGDTFGRASLISMDGTSGYALAIFDFADLRNSIIDEIWSARDSGHLWGSEISEEVMKRLDTARSRPSLASHLYASATDHLISEIVGLLDEVPGVVSAGSANRIWVGVSNSDDPFKWISDASLANFVSCLVVCKSSVRVENGN